MTVPYEYDAENQNVTVRPSGILGLADIVDYIDRLRNDPNIGTVRNEIVHFEEVTDFTITYSEIKSVLEAYEGIVRQKGLEKTIFVAPQDLQYGIARMVGGIFGERFTTRAVRSIDEASSLLEEPGA